MVLEKFKLETLGGIKLEIFFAPPSTLPPPPPAIHLEKSLPQKWNIYLRKKDTPLPPLHPQSTSKNFFWNIYLRKKDVQRLTVTVFLWS